MADQGWQPIATAPKDKRVLVAFDDGDLWRGVCESININGWSDGVGGTLPATHWMPLPAPPADHTPKGEA